MKYINKYTVGTIILTLVILGFTVDILPDRINVELPSTVCSSSILRVTKDDFTLKCGNRIAFQADTIVEYFKTYGEDEWVRNFRYVGRVKKDITLELFEYENKFDIVRTTRYRKGRQYAEDGTLKEIYTFTPDKVKISYEYEVNNKAKHRISMRIKKQYNSYLDAFDPNGHAGMLTGNTLSYEGFGDLSIDPTVTLHSPATLTVQYNEGDTISFTCSCNYSNESKLTNMSLWWDALNESDWHSNETTTLTANTTTTYSKVIPHPVTSTFPGTFKWNCECCRETLVQGSNCSFASSNFTVDSRYKPEMPVISSPNSTELNLFNGSLLDWSAYTFYPGYIHKNSTERNETIYINWSAGELRDNKTNIIWNLSYYGTTTSTRIYDTNFRYSTINTTTFALFNVSALKVDRWYVMLRACNALNETLCETDTLDIPIDIFDYDINITTGETKIRFSPQPTITKGAALGQTATKGIISVDWLGNRYPDGQINLSINHTGADKCMDIYAYNSNTPASAVHLANNTYVTVLKTTDADPDYIWLWATKSSCGTTTTNFQLDLDLFFGGT